MSSNDTANMSWSTKASRSAGSNCSKTTNSANPTESTTSTSCSKSRPLSEPTIGSKTCDVINTSNQTQRTRNAFRLIRATTVVSQPPKLSISSASIQLSRSHTSYTTSSTSFSDPNMR